MKNMRIAAVVTIVAFFASPAHAGWLNDAIGSFVTETLADLQTLGVTLAIIAFIAGVVMWMFSWGQLRIPIIAVLGGAVIALADTFIG